MRQHRVTVTHRSFTIGVALMRVGNKIILHSIRIFYVAQCTYDCNTVYSRLDFREVFWQDRNLIENVNLTGTSVLTATWYSLLAFRLKK